MTSAIAERALVAARFYGFELRRPSVREVALGSTAEADLLVLTDDGTPDVGFERLRAEVFVLVVASPAAARILPVALAHDEAAAPWPKARAWAARRTSSAVAPAVGSARLAAIADAAEAAGLVLVERELPPFLGGLRPTMPSPLDRAITLTVATGALAKPVVLVPRPKAPKNGLAKAKPERLLDAYVRRRAQSEAASAFAPVSIEAAAIDALDASDRALSGKQLLREARDRWIDRARKLQKKTVTPSTDDAAKLAMLLVRLFDREEVDFFSSASEAGAEA